MCCVCVLCVCAVCGRTSEPDGATTEFDINTKDLSTLGACDLVLDSSNVGGLVLSGHGWLVC